VYTLREFVEMKVRFREQQVALFLFAHNDDEFFVLPAIEAEIASGRRVVCIYTTDGAAYGEDSNRRLRESLSVLSPRGVGEDDVVPLGKKIGIRDGTSFRFMAQIWDELLAFSADLEIASVYVLGWEGGHADHDAGHLLGIALAKLKGVEAHEFSLYNSWKMRPPFFRCMALVPAAGESKSIKVPWLGVFVWLLSVRYYVSQWRTFLGLLGFCLPQILVRRELELRRVGVRDYQCPPHEGKLMYESRFKVPHCEFLGATSRFIKEHIEDSSADEVVFSQGVSPVS
jgi:hypothetical protein